jgi:hypothetical protein
VKVTKRWGELNKQVEKLRGYRVNAKGRENGVKVEAVMKG